MRHKFLALLLLMLAPMLAMAAGGGFRQSHLIPTLTNDADGICQDQTTSGAADLSLDGDLVTAYRSAALQTPCNPSMSNNGPSTCAEAAAAQQISIEGTGNNLGITFTLTGTDADGYVQTEVLTGANNGTVTSVLYYKTMDTIAASGAVTGNVEIGWLSANGAVSGTLVPDLAGHAAPLAISVTMTGTMTYTIQHTLWNMPSKREPTWSDNVDLTSKTASDEGNIGLPVGGIRAQITAYTSGTLDLMFLQGKIR